MAEQLRQATDVVRQSQDEVAALVRAIRHAFQSPSGFSGLEAFHLSNIHQFAQKLMAEGVRAGVIPPPKLCTES
jgi:hypothetical protein